MSLWYMGCGERKSESSLETSSEKELSSGDTQVSVISEAFREIELESVEGFPPSPTKRPGFQRASRRIRMARAI